jgi:hypothetical protein
MEKTDPAFIQPTEIREADSIDVRELRSSAKNNWGLASRKDLQASPHSRVEDFSF